MARQVIYQVRAATDSTTEGNDMTTTRKVRAAIGLLAVASLALAACGDEGDEDAATDTEATDTAEPEDAASNGTNGGEADDAAGAGDTASDGGNAGDRGEATDSATICETDALVAAVESGADEGTLAGMTDDPVGTAASNNPVLTNLTAAVTEAGLVDTLNSAEALTVFAPTDCAFATVDPALLDAVMADPQGLLTQILGFHVVAGHQLSAEELAGATELETLTGASLPVETSGDSVTVGGQATVLVPDIQTANATVHLIDAVMLPPEG